MPSQIILTVLSLLLSLSLSLSLSPHSHYEQDRSALKKKEWERRTQEVQQDEDLFSTGFNLFGEPYKTNKGDALANRVQNTLGNYDEMKELLTSHSSQSHLVGIPKNSIPQTPVEKVDQPSFFSEAQRSRGASSQPGNHAASMPPPPTTALPGPNVLHQGNKNPSTASTSTHPSRRHGPSAKAPAPAELGHGKSPGEQEPGSHGCGSPVASTSLLPGGLSTPTFPQGLHCKSSSAVQQKPTAYVRPMDGQDQVPNDSPELKPPPEIGDSYGGATFGALLDGKGSTAGSKAKLPKLNLPQSGEVSSGFLLLLENSPANACVNVVPLQEMTHSWPPPLTAIHTPGKAEQTNLPGPTPRSSDPAGHSSGASGSSSESESSSESDSDSESSSSDSECNRATRAATPEPEPPSTNKWQLDKWLNKVNPHNKALTNTQPESHGLSRSQPEEDQAAESQNCSKSKPSASLAQADSKDRALLSPIREKAKPKMGQKAPDGKGAKVKTPATVDLAPSRRSTGKKQPKKVERSSSSEEHNWPRPANSSTTQKEKEPPPLEPAKARGKAPGGKTAPRKEPRSTAVTTTAATSTTAADKKKHRGPSKIIPKSKEFIETESSSSECHSDPEELSKVHLPCPGPSNLNLKSKDCNSNILSVSSLASTSSTSIPDPGTTDLLEEPFFSPIPMVQNELLSPLRDFEDIKSLWVKIELSLLSRIPGQDPPEPPPPTKAECREPSVKHRRQQSPASIPPEKPTSKSKRKHKAYHPLGAHYDQADSVILIGCLKAPLNACSDTHEYLMDVCNVHVKEAHDHSQWLISVHCFLLHSVHNADYYMQEAKKLKHKADALMEKFGKAVNYADGALSFIECGSAMERDPLEAKSPYTMYSETVELIRYAMRLKNFTSHSATLAEKKLAVLCNRCLSLLYLRMFKLKKEHAMKYSRSLMEYFKHALPLPCRSTGTPSPMSLSPSPISSVSSSTGAVGSSSSSSSSSSSGSVAIPQRIHHMAASHVNITNNILRSYEHWDTADKLAHESQEFFQELDSVMEPLTQHSSMTELVRYIRQGLHWLRIEAHLL
uniref:AF4/FMR2 C-terminal homology domain-containing protein n=1 Tax=Electrophorus electricus TaxID=8005 RepID=A0A4W4GHA3_ELEEL